MCFRGEISVRKAANQIGITPLSVWRLKKRYAEKGDAIFIHGNTGREPANKRKDRAEIADFYKTHFFHAPFAVCADYYSRYRRRVPYTTLHAVLSERGFVSPRARIPKREKKKHKPRKERDCEGELLQIDASSHEWIFGRGKLSLHGAIDDATHKITALYLCENECRLGYNEVLLRTTEKFGGFPKAIYSDRSRAFFETKEAVGKVSIEEQLAGIRKSKTQWQKLAEKAHVKLIIALSAEAKGRIERLWQTLQGRLPWIFAYHGIRTVEKANVFLRGFVDDFNAQFAVAPKKRGKKWHAERVSEYDFALQAEKKTRADGSFIYHGERFRLIAPRAACVRFTLCLSARRGVWALMSGREYGVELSAPILDAAGDAMSAVEKELIARYLCADMHSGTAAV